MVPGITVSRLPDTGSPAPGTLAAEPMSPETGLAWKLRLGVSEAGDVGLAAAEALASVCPIHVSAPLRAAPPQQPEALRNQLGAGGHGQGRRAAPSAEKTQVEFFIDRINPTLLATRTQHSTCGAHVTPA